MAKATNKQAEIRCKASKLSGIIKPAKNLGIEELALKFKENSVLINSKDPASVLMYAVKVEDGFFQKYDRGGIKEVAFKLSPVIESLSTVSGKADIRFEIGGSGADQFVLDGDNTTIKLGLIDPDSVENTVDDQVQLEWPVHGTVDSSKFNSFIDEADGIIDSNDIVIRAESSSLRLYSEQDGNEIHTIIEEPKYEPRKFKTDSFTSMPEHPDDKIGESAVESVFSTEFLDDIPAQSDGAKISLGNDMPMRLIFEPYDWATASWIVTPRIPTDAERNTIPKNV